jgi:hypothetical protein
VNDEQFLHAFRQRTLPVAHFHHRDHLRLAWLLCRQIGGEAASAAIGDGIRGFAAAHGQAAKYHDSITRFWVRVVNHMARSRPEIEDFDAFLAAFPLLLDKDLPYRHWRRETLAGAAARADWVPPDLLPLPA